MPWVGKKKIMCFVWIWKEKVPGVYELTVSPSTGSVGDQRAKPLTGLQYLA